MPLKLTSSFDEKNELVITVPIGEVNSENVIKTVKKALEVSEEKSCPFLLFDISKCELDRPFIDGFNDMVSFGQKTGLSLKHSVAVVYDPNNYPEERAEFIQSVANTMTDTNYRMFKDYDSALHWMQELQEKKKSLI